MKANRTIKILIICLLSIETCYWACSYSGILGKTKKDSALTELLQHDTFQQRDVLIKKKANEAIKFCRSKNMNLNFCILIDMNIHSGFKRFYIYNFNEDSVLYRFLVSHGCCNNPWGEDISKDKPDFSNIEESHCSSLGKYKIGVRGYSSWGVKTKYLLHGLEQSNSNAMKRNIVFHSWDRVSDNEVYPDGTPEGWGCPSVSNNSFIITDSLLKKSIKPVLMWIYKD